MVPSHATIGAAMASASPGEEATKPLSAWSFITRCGGDRDEQAKAQHVQQERDEDEDDGGLTRHGAGG